MSDRADYSSSVYIGKRYGSLTVIDYIHGRFNVRCDCGFEKTVKCNNVIGGRTMTCGRYECKYHQKTMNYYGKYGELVREVGEDTEKEICDKLVAMGYTVERTPSSGDYGVDLIFTCNNGDRAAIQIKNNQKTKQKTGVHAIQEVFSGGLFYDCNKFVVISYTGYTDNAIKIADKLGVMLCDENFRLFEKPNYHFNTKHFWNVNGVYEPMSVTFRREGWDNSHCERFYNMTYEQVKELQEKRKIRKSQLLYCKEHDMSYQYINYRMKTMGMTFEQAVNEPKHTNGRPRKQGVAV